MSSQADGDLGAVEQEHPLVRVDGQGSLLVELVGDRYWMSVHGLGLRSRDRAAARHWHPPATFRSIESIHRGVGALGDPDGDGLGGDDQGILDDRSFGGSEPASNTLFFFFFFPVLGSVRATWDSFEDDAFIRDRETGRFFVLRRSISPIIAASTSR